MKKFISISFLVLLTALIFNCKDKKRPPWIDMRAVQADGSYDDKFIFRKEIEEEQKRTDRYKRDNFE
ncbi:MAG: hypothetical protein FWH53_07910 [Leptospirales bacterium]|nr:hypothetical protein [Leptospirales bacterium]